MPNETNTDKIRSIELNFATLNERVDNLREELKKQDESIDLTSKTEQEINRRLSVFEHRVESIEKRFDELLVRRWDLWKLILAAFLGSILTIGSGFLGGILNRLVFTPTQQSIRPTHPDSPGK